MLKALTPQVRDMLVKEGWRFVSLLIRRGLVELSKANDTFEDALNTLETATGQDLDGDGDTGEDTY